MAKVTISAARQLLQEKTLYVTCEEKYYVITSEGSHLVEEQETDQEEADTRLILHASHAADNNIQSVVMVVEDTDVFVLCLNFDDEINASLYLKCTTNV